MRVLYEIRAKHGAGDTILTTRATDYHAAALSAARRLYGRRATARRVTGEPGYNGIFQAYEPMRGGGLNSTGEPFHVSRA